MDRGVAHSPRSGSTVDDGVRSFVEGLLWPMGNDNVVTLEPITLNCVHSVFRTLIFHTEKHRNHIDMVFLHAKRQSFSVFIGLIRLAAVRLGPNFEKVGYCLISTVKKSIRHQYAHWIDHSSVY